MHVIANIRVGRPDTRPDAPTHVRGMREGNKPRHVRWKLPFWPVDGIGVATAARSTGINSKSRRPVDPRAPNLTPA